MARESDAPQYRALGLCGLLLLSSGAALAEQPVTADPADSSTGTLGALFERWQRLLDVTLLPRDDVRAHIDARLEARRQDAEVQRQQRDAEREALRQSRDTEREAWLERWQRQQEAARQHRLEHERRYRQEQEQRFPGLAEHRRRNAEELQKRWQEIERRRQQHIAEDTDVLAGDLAVDKAATTAAKQ